MLLTTTMNHKMTLTIGQACPRKIYFQMLVVPKLCIATLVRSLATPPPGCLGGGVGTVRISVTKLCHSVTLIRTLATSPPPPRLGIDLGPLLSYCATHSSPLHPALRDLQVEALKTSMLIAQ